MTTEEAVIEARAVLAQKPKSYVMAASSLARAVLDARERELALLAILKRMDSAYAASAGTDGAPTEAR